MPVQWTQEELEEIKDVSERARSIQEPISRSRHLPGECYSSDVIRRLEEENLFKKDWIIIGRQEEIPNAGDYFTRRIAGEPILVSRAKDGNIYANYNVCRHRGVEVAFKCGNRRNFSCPYHGWVYDLSGKLLSAPLMEQAEGFDKDANGLTSVKVHTWGGFIFVNLDPECASFEDSVGHLLKKMDFLRFEDCEVVDVWEFNGPCNWKLVIENVMDIYHVALLHAATLGKDWNDDEVKVEMLPGGSMYSEFPNPTLTADGESRFGNLPWLPDAGPRFANSLCLPPNTMLFGRCDSMYVFHSFPIDANTCHAFVMVLMPKEVKKLPDFEERIKPYAEFTRAVLSEDFEMLVSIQANFKSEDYVPGQMAPLEHAIRNFLAGYVEKLFGKDESLAVAAE